MRRNIFPVVALACFLPSVAFSQGAVQWGSTEKAYRQPVDGMRGYYEPGKVERNEDVVAFKIFRAADPAVNDEVGSYMVNCYTHEYATVEKGKPSAPIKLLAGEDLYSISSKLCDWGNGTGFFKSFF